MVEEMLIARVHMHVKVLQVCGAQYKYRGHVVHFLRKVGRLFEELPVLPEELDIVLLRPPNMEGDPHFQQQFAHDFRVRRSCLLARLHYLQHHHPGYRDIVVRQDRLQRLPLDGSIVASIASQVADIPDGEVPQGPVEEAVEEDPSDADASAIPNLQVTETELNALRSRFPHGTPDPERMTDLEHMPPSAQAQHQMPLPSIRRTPINEFNRSQPLLTLAFPTLYPDGKADFVEPRLRSVTYQDYLAHAIRWQDGRFARHETWPFVALNTLLRAQVRKRSNYSVKQHEGRRQPLTRADLEEAMAKPDDQINHYNPLLTVAWLANTDVSPCTSLQQVIDYAAKYCSKSEKKSEAFAQIGKALMPRVKDHNPLISFTSKLLNQLVAKRDYSKQEVSHLLLGLPLQEGSRTCLYVDCRNPDMHSRSLQIDGDEVDEVPNIYEKYYRRPEALEDLTYVSFLKYWNFPSRNPSMCKQWQLSNVNGRPRVLVYFPRYRADPEGQQWPDYCRVKLTLNHPHRRLDELLTFDGQRFSSHAKAFSYCWQHHSHGDDHYGRPKEARLQPQEDQYETLPVEEGFDDEDWIRLAALLPDNPLTQEGLDLLGRCDIDVNYDWTRHVGTYQEFRDSYWKDLIASHPIANDVEVLGPHWRDQLNPQQRLVYDTFMGHFQAQNPAQILLHVDGGGGTGKSFLIKVLSSHLQAAALPNPSPICRAAPTGVVVLLPTFPQPTQPPFSPVYGTSKYLVIDEKSMLGLEQLARIDSRLRQAFPQRRFEFFGGVSVLPVGDFFQLPPVRQKPLYSTSTSLSSLERRGQVAYRLFDRTVFLTTAQRQAGDDQARFRQALQELREVKLSIPSWNLLSNRVQAKLTQSEVDRFRAALRVYSTKARVSEYNYEHMVHLNSPAIQVEAKNQGSGAGQAPSDNAGNLSNKIPVAKGARGTVYDIVWNAGANPWEDPPAVIMVDFGSYDGPPYLTTNEGRKIVPILPVTRDFLVVNETCARTQFPLIVAFAITVHKCQSLTKDQIVTDLATRDFQAGISYVAVSRVTSLQGLLLEAPFDRQSLYNTPTEGMKMRLADQQRRQAQQLTDPPYPPRYIE
ncbi:ATP-dependent DNA helicase [Fusarium falciforme]|uniref:ATP-dependent DNA helicase n=1 Tax=Fusarium falciforme TaxID=195108 RepID=UPI0023005492|nr:ATP-dependent DNA helicase [Fusarium falciforme]WAO96950.1 ATP-dependent DNA helicase [Fusarium falciforme]